MALDCCEHGEGSNKSIVCFESEYRCPLCELEDILSESQASYDELEKEFDDYKDKYKFHIQIADAIERGENG